LSKQDLTEKQQKQKQRDNENRRIQAKYGGLAFSMAIAVGFGVFIGQKLDERMQTDKPYWTAGLAVLFLFVIMYSKLKDLINPPKKK
jgi:hypothetical protein